MAHRAHLRGGGVRAWGREVGSEVERDRGVREPRAHRVPSRGRCRGQSCAEAPRARAGPPAVSRPTRLCSGGRSERLSSANYGKGAGSGLRLELVWSRVSGKRTARAGEGGRAPGEEKSDAHQRHEPGDPERHHHRLPRLRWPTTIMTLALRLTDLARRTATPTTAARPMPAEAAMAMASAGESDCPRNFATWGGGASES